MSRSSIAILLCNLGTPERPDPSAVRAFLREFLSDPRVVEVPRPIWLMILYAFILPFRPRPVSEGYQALWDEYGDSPLRLITREQVNKLSSAIKPLSQKTILVDYLFSYGEPSLKVQLDKYKAQADQIVLLPLYPQYSCSTTAAIYDQLADYQKSQRNIPEVIVVKDYYHQASYQKTLAESVKKYWAEHDRSEHLLISHHGVPKRYADLGDPYYQQCIDTAAQLAEDLGLQEGEYTASFQSRLGKAEWLQPYTDKTVMALAKKGIKSIDVVCPSFSVDCLETLEEIAVENRDFFREAGGETLRLIPCLNAEDSHIAMMIDIIRQYVNL